MKPWKVKGWVIPPEQNGEFVANMEKVLGVYKRPYNYHNPVICMDESPKQLIGETKIPIAMKSGQERKEDYEYTRNGVCNIFMANEPLIGKRYPKITFTKKKQDWAQYIKEVVDTNYADRRKVTLVMDNFGTHTLGAFYESFEPKEAKRLMDKIDFIFTPKHGSWLNMAEIELNVLTGQCLNRRIANIETVEDEVKAWAEHRNNSNATINWQFKTSDARIKLRRLYPSINH